MGRDDWYRHREWDADIEEDFERRLGRTRGHGPWYLAMQGSELVDSGNPSFQEVGLALFQRSIRENPDSTQAVQAHERLFKSLMALGRYQEAEDAARRTITFWKAVEGKGHRPSVPPHLKLAEAILAQRDRRRWPEIEEHLAIAGEDFENDLIFPVVGYRFLVARARVQRMYGGRGAALSAIRALDFVDGPRGPNRGYPAALGARPQSEEIKELRRILVLDKWPLRWVDGLLRFLDPRSHTPQYHYHSYR